MLSKSQIEMLDADSLRSNISFMSQFVNTYKQIFGTTPCITCKGRLEQSVTQLKNALTNNPGLMEEKKFVIKDNTVISTFGTSLSYTNANITDESAIEILRRNPKTIKWFKTFPDDWQELLNPKENSVNEEHEEPEEIDISEVIFEYEELKKLKVPELKKIAKELGLKNYSKLKEDEVINLILDSKK